MDIITINSGPKIDEEIVSDDFVSIDYFNVYCTSIETNLKELIRQTVFFFHNSPILLIIAETSPYKSNPRFAPNI